MPVLCMWLCDVYVNVYVEGNIASDNKMSTLFASCKSKREDQSHDPLQISLQDYILVRAGNCSCQLGMDLHF